MRILTTITLLGCSAALAGCMTYGPPVQRTAAACGTYGYVDSNNDGFITGAEWNSYRTGAYGYWDTDKDGRISRMEFENCWYGGGFYRDAYYRRDWWEPYWTGFDADRDGFLSADEYFSAQAWARADRNNNGRIDANEWQWWMG